MRKYLPLAAAAAWLLVVAGTAMAQRYNEGPLPPTGPSSLAITAPGPGMAPPITAAAVGRNLLTNRNDIIGYIIGVRNDALIVRPGNNFGISPKAVVVPRDYVYVTGDTIHTQMTGSQLASMPAYIAPKASLENMQVNPTNGRP